MIQKNQNRGFGLLFFIVFLVLALWPLRNGGEINLYLIFIALIFLLLGLVNSKILTPLKKGWIKFGEILGRIIAPIVMAVVYFLILTPISLFVILISEVLDDLSTLLETWRIWGPTTVLLPMT